jgi:hypothetical protein
MSAPAKITLNAGTFLKSAPKIGTKTMTTTGLMERITPNGAWGPNMRSMYLIRGGGRGEELGGERGGGGRGGGGGGGGFEVLGGTCLNVANVLLLSAMVPAAAAAASSAAASALTLETWHPYGDK